MAATVLTKDQSEDTPSPPAPRPGWRFDALVIGGYVLLGLFIGAHFWVDVRDRVSGHLPIDHTWFEWLLAHGAHTVRHLDNPFFSHQQNAPDGVNLMANTSVLGVTIPLAPITMLFGVQVSFVLWICGAMAATAATSYWVLSRHLVRSRGAAIVGGAFLGFAPGVVHHANGQPNFVSNFLLPLIVARVFQLGQPGRWLRNGSVLGLLVAWQVFINEEMLLLTAIGCAVAVIAYALFRRPESRNQIKPFLYGMGIAAAVALAITAYPIWFQFKGPQAYHGILNGAYHRWGEDPWAYVTYPRDTIGGMPAAERFVGVTEQNTWFGWPLVGLCLLTIVLLWRTSLTVRISAIVAAFFALFSLGPRIRFQGQLTNAHGIWWFIPDNLPMVEMMMPARFSFGVVAVVGVLVAVAWDRIASKEGVERSVRYFAFGAVILALLPLAPKPLPAKYAPPPPHFITSGEWQQYVPDGRTLVPVPIPNNVVGVGLDTLRWNARELAEFRIPGGYFIGPDADGDGIFGAPVRPTTALIYDVTKTGVVPAITDTQRQQAQADLRYWNASVVVLGDHPRQPQLKQLMTELLGQDGWQVDDVWLWQVTP